MRRALVIVGKAPVAGRAKTRLVPPLSPEQAAQVARAFLQDTVDMGLSLGWDRVSVVHPRSASDATVLAALLPAAVRRCPQAGDGLGDALRGAFAAHFAEGFDQVVLIGSDTPQLSSNILVAASEALHEKDLAIGPCTDGGWYLLGLRRRCDRVFEDIPWSTDQVFAQTLLRAAEASLSVQSLPVCSDVDTVVDLWRVRDALCDQPAHTARRTRAALDGLAVLSSLSG